MRRVHRIVVLATLIAIAPVFAGCSDFDPDKLDVFHLNEKKKLPGTREPLFPNGVPGVSQGIPPEYMKGYHEQQVQQADAALAQPGATPSNAAAAGKPAQRTAAVTPVETKPKPKPKPKHVRHKAKAKPKPKPRTAEPAPAPQPAAAQPQQQLPPWPGSQPQPQPQQGSASPWPSTPPATSSTPWPSAPPPGTFSR